MPIPIPNATRGAAERALAARSKPARIFVFISFSSNFRPLEMHGARQDFSIENKGDGYGIG
jgi:hypothetical protein